MPLAAASREWTNDRRTAHSRLVATTQQTHTQRTLRRRVSGALAHVLMRRPDAISHSHTAAPNSDDVFSAASPLASRRSPLSINDGPGSHRYRFESACRSRMASLCSTTSPYARAFDDGTSDHSDRLLGARADDLTASRVHGARGAVQLRISAEIQTGENDATARDPHTQSCCSILLDQFHHMGGRSPARTRSMFRSAITRTMGLTRSTETAKSKIELRDPRLQNRFVQSVTEMGR